MPLEQVDRARLDGDEGLLKVHVRKGTDRVVGATLVARDAGNIIAGLTLAIGAGIGLKRLAEAIHPYPTQAEALKRAADAFNRARVAPRLRALSERILAWRR